MRWVPCKWRRVFLPVKALDSAQARSEMHEQIKECTLAHHHRSSFKQKSKQKINFCSFIAPFHRMLSHIVYKSCVRQPLCDETLCLCQNVWAFFTSSYTVQSQASPECTMQWTIRGTYITSGTRLYYTDCNKHFVYWVCSLKLPSSCPV